MSFPPVLVPESPAVQRGPSETSSRRRWFEVSLITFMAFSGPFLRAIAQYRAGPSTPGQYDNYSWLAITFHEIGILLLLGYFLWSNGRSFRDIGFHWSWRHAAVGLLLFLVALPTFLVGSGILHLGYRLILGAAPPVVDARQIFGHIPWMALPFTLMNPFFEELVVRAYLMTELGELTGSIWIGAAVSLVLQTSYHIYYGWLGALSVGVLFLVFTIYFAIWRKALPLVIAHGIDDLIGFIRLH